LLADRISDVLDRLLALDLRSGTPLGAREEARALEFLRGCDFFLIDDVIDDVADLSGGGRYTVINPFKHDNDIVDLADAMWPLDTGTVVTRDYGYCFHRICSISPKEARGLAKQFAPKMVRIWTCSISNDGNKWFADDRICGLINGQWLPVDIGIARERTSGPSTRVRERIDNQKNRDELHQIISMTFSEGLSRRYAWHVALGFGDDGPRVLVTTNPTGCLKFFQDRERSQNSTRRAALRHWVTHHFRNAAEGITYVRDHLRGQTTFRWADLACELLVSQFDLEKNEAFKLEADQWRASRKHNRVRVRLKQRSNRPDDAGAEITEITT